MGCASIVKQRGGDLGKEEKSTVKSISREWIKGEGVGNYDKGVGRSILHIGGSQALHLNSNCVKKLSGGE